ncbi:hypothetical protein MNBD_GAMMA08-1381 [hydrothermal vent metagenome]|uniref:Putative zinc-finger domain-containing protein n=1 Tax=hydrothermal vent metagenome TaxID=652676 RepID=A0A3B0XDL0_9ZZZZ
MNCEDIQTQLDDYLDNHLIVGSKREMDLHINNCSACRQHLDDAMVVRDALKSLPIEETSADFESRMFANVRKQQSQNGNRFISGFATAMAASVFLWVASTTIFVPQQSDNTPTAISIAMHEARPVRLLFDAPSDLQQVTLSIELPANVELDGYPGRSQLSWNTRLKKGQNVLTLPINAINVGKGELVAQLTYGDKQKTYRLILKTSDNGVMTYQIQPLTSA